MFFGLILRGPPVIHRKGMFLNPPQVVEVVRSFHISKAVLFNPLDFFADGASSFVRVLVHNSRTTVEICRLYNNRTGQTQTDLDLTFSRGDSIAFFNSVFYNDESEVIGNYYPEVHLSGYFLEPGGQSLANLESSYKQVFPQSTSASGTSTQSDAIVKLSSSSPSPSKYAPGQAPEERPGSA